MEKTIKITGRQEDLEVVCKLLRHIEYLGIIGASRNILVRVDGDGTGRIMVFNEDGTKIDNEEYNYKNQSSGAIVGTYDIG